MTRRAWFLAVSLIAGAAVASTPKLMFPVPAAAEKPQHVVMSPGTYEQDYFWIKAQYPATPALSHYEKIFAKWRKCRGKQEGWDGYGDISGTDPRYVHNFLRYWVSLKNDRAVTLLFQYQSKGVDYRKRPDDDKQFVALIQHWTPNAEKFFADIHVQCEKVPNSAMDDNTVSYALRAPHGARHRER
jgi:hypothetical protein